MLQVARGKFPGVSIHESILKLNLCRQGCLFRRLSFKSLKP